MKDMQSLIRANRVILESKEQLNKMPKLTETFKSVESSPKEETIKRKARIARKGLNLDSIKIIPASEVPPPSRARTPYRELLEKIGKGQAVCLTPQQVSLVTASSAIRKLQKKGEFTNFKVTRRTVDGEKRLYIINEDKPEEDSA